jgi:hypothetical protein
LHGTVGLVWASNLGIFVQTMAMAVLLHRCRLARLSGIEWKELTRTLLTAVLALIGLRGMMHLLPHHTGMMADAISLTLGTLIWVAISAGLLTAMGSQLPQIVLGRLRKRAA